MLATEFDFVAPTDLTEALRLLDEGGASAMLLAGGMSLLPLMHLGVARPKTVVSLSRLSDLCYVADEGEAIRIGPLMTHTDLSTHALVRRECPVLANTAGILADVQVRNRGTIGGSLAHANPGAEYLTLLAALDGEVLVRSVRAERLVKVRELAVGANETILAPAEMIVAVRVPKVPPGNAAYIRYSRVQGNYSTVNTAALIGPDGGTVAIGGALQRPVLVETPISLASATTDDELSNLASAAEDACRDAHDDHVATGEYRRAMAGVFARRVVELAFAAPSAARKD